MRSYYTNRGEAMKGVGAAPEIACLAAFAIGGFVARFSRQESPIN
jgi:hypothetical protein